MLAQVKTAASNSIEQNAQRSAQEMSFTDPGALANQHFSNNDSSSQRHSHQRYPVYTTGEETAFRHSRAGSHESGGARLENRPNSDTEHQMRWYDGHRQG
jgi:hypothetical protein